MHFNGIIVGLATFLIIGLFHPIVIKAEYHFGKKCWWVFALAGIAFGALSLFIDNITLASISGVTHSPVSGQYTSFSSRKNVC